MRLFVGTSGYSYTEWKGSFYPEKLPAKQMLHFYGQHFAAVEMNNTFYRMPQENILESWAEQVPEAFQFVLKAPQLITHRKRLKNTEADLEQLFVATAALRSKRGPLFFQLPPNFKKDVPLLQAFLDLVGDRAQTAFEFRHDSWFDEEVFACLRAHSCALCTADTDEAPNAQIVSTAPWGYLRLRCANYSDQQLEEWFQRVKSQAWESAYVFFKHEDSGTAPKFAARFLEFAGK